MAPKRSVTDDYRMEKRICQTSSGSISLISKISTSEQYAMKMMKKKALVASLKNLGLTSVTHEADILKTLSHPNIIKYEATYETDTVVYLITEFLEGGELYSEIDQGIPHTEDEIKMATLKLLEAVCYLHSQNIAHRDIKLENIMLRKAKDITDVVLIDFGMSKKYNEHRKMAEICGTINYIAPEVYYAADYDSTYDEKVDCWGIGVILFTMLFRRFPVPYTLPQSEIKRRTMCDELDYPADKECTYSQEAMDLLRKLLCVDPEARPSCQEALNHAWFSCDSTSDLAEEDKNIVSTDSNTIAETDSAKEASIDSSQSQLESESPDDNKQDAHKEKDATNNNSDSSAVQITLDPASVVAVVHVNVSANGVVVGGEDSVHTPLPNIDKKKSSEVLLALARSHSQQSNPQTKLSDGRIQSPKSSPGCKTLCIPTSPIDSSDETHTPC